MSRLVAIKSPTADIWVGIEDPTVVSGLLWHAYTAYIYFIFSLFTYRVDDDLDGYELITAPNQTLEDNEPEVTNQPSTSNSCPGTPIIDREYYATPNSTPPQATNSFNIVKNKSYGISLSISTELLNEEVDECL